MNIGERIYYTGDRANIDGQGTITMIHPADKFYGPSVTIKMDDGREWRKILFVMFDDSPGRRFWLLKDWKADQQAKIADMNRRYARL
jgi:hypothetical protein